MKIPFNKPYLTGKEFEYMKDAVSRGKISGDGFYSEKVHAFIESKFGAKKALFRHVGNCSIRYGSLVDRCEKRG